MFEDITKIRQLIDSFDTSYYDNEIKKIENEIQNLENGLDENGNKFTSYNKKTDQEIQKDIVEHKEYMKELNEKSNELSRLLNEMDLLSSKIEAIAKENALLELLYYDVKALGYDENKKYQGYPDNKVKRIYLKESKSLSNKSMFIERKLYNLLKNKSKKYYANKHGDKLEKLIRLGEYAEIEHKRKTPYGHIVKDTIYGYKDGYGNLKHFTEMINSETQSLTSHNIFYDKEHVNIKLENVELKSYDKDLEKILFDIEQFSVNNTSNKKINMKKLYKAKELYSEALKLAKEVAYLDSILEYYGKTSIKESKTYQRVQKLRDEKYHLQVNLEVEADKYYEKSNFKVIVDDKETLEQLYREVQDLRRKIEEYRNNGSFYSKEYIEELENKIMGLRYKMEQILLVNPELNRPEYDIDIEELRKENEEFRKLYIEKNITEEDYEKLDTEVENPENIASQQNEEVISNNKSEFEEYVEERFKETSKSNSINEQEKIEQIELDYNLQLYRTMYYSKYMTEKVKNSALGRVSFSKYLEIEAPHLTELIEIEKKRENQANTIFKEYIIYYSALENKKLAMEFEMFAQRRYGIENIDIPVEYEEEYKGMHI